MAYNLLLLLILLPGYCLGQGNVKDYKSELKALTDQSQKQDILLKILDYYTQPGQLKRDSIKKYNALFLDVLSDSSPLEKKVLGDSYRLLSDYKMPYDQYEKLSQKNIADYYSLNNYEGVLKAHYYLSSKASRSGIEQSISMYEKGLQMTEEFKGHLEEDLLCRYKSSFLSGIASNYERRMLFEQAISFALESVDNAETCGDSLGLLYAYRSAGAILGNAEEAIINIEESPLDISLELKRILNRTLLYSKKLEHDVIYTLASYNLALYHYRNGSIDLALNYLKDSESVEDLQWVPKQKYFNQILLSDIYQEQGYTDESFEALESAHAATLELNDPHYLNQISLDYSKWYYLEESYSKSLEALQEIDIADANDLYISLKYYEALYKIEKAQKNYFNALLANEQFHYFQDSLNKISSEKSISKLIGQYKISKANEEIALLKSNQLSNKLSFQRRAGIGIFSFVFILGLIGAQSFSYKQNLLKSREENQKVRQKLFRAQMNPHFVFNTLGSIQSFLLQPNKSKDAAYFLTKFAKLMRQILTQSQKDLISIEEEVKTLENYLLLQKMRFENKFDFSITIDPELNHSLNIPPMVIQPIIENAIEHGKIYNVESGFVSVMISKLRRSMIKVEIKDNGIGIIAAEDKCLKNKTSISTSIINQRLHILSQKMNVASKITFESPVAGGTLVTITLPRISNAHITESKT